MIAALLAAFVLTSPNFADGARIPKTYTCEGRNVSPALRWTAPPRGTRAFAISMVDTDARFRHWIAWGIPAVVRAIAAGWRPLHEGTNSFGRRGYDGPCPPPEPKHHYVFRLYALDANVGPPFTGHVLATARVTGTFIRA
jgi:Raf kinase inhibitor-like YbhB/YbcL family protein